MSDAYRLRECWMHDILAAKDLAPGCKMTAIRLALHQNLRTGQLNPSMETLAKETNQLPRTVARHIQALQELGWVRQRPRKGGIGRTSNSYLLETPQTLSLPTMLGATGLDQTLPKSAANHDIGPPQPRPAWHTNNLNIENTSAPDRQPRRWTAESLRTAIIAEVGKKCFDSTFRSAKIEVGPPITITSSLCNYLEEKFRKQLSKALCSELKFDFEPVRREGERIKAAGG